MLVALIVPLLLCALMTVVLADNDPAKGSLHAAELVPQDHVVLCSSPGLAIPDNDPAGTVDTLYTGEAFTFIEDLNLYISTTHTWVGDLMFSLIDLQTGSGVYLIDQPGVPATPLGCSGDDIDATLDDEATLPVEDQCAASVPTIAGSFTPLVPLAAFDGRRLAGSWELHVQDNAGGDTGTLVSWCLEAWGTPYESDLGDAPDSSNHDGVDMIAYPAAGGQPAVLANFPTVYDPRIELDLVGPLHVNHGDDSWLGASLSAELDADLLPDRDGVTNISPAAGWADRDGSDDGVIMPLDLPHCILTRLTYQVTVAPGAPTAPRYVNVWFDWNRDGDWADELTCPGPLTVPESVLEDHLITVGPGVHTLTTPWFLPYNPDPERPMWMRITLSEQIAPVDPGTSRADGRGPYDGYVYGETEDYYLGFSTYLPLVIRNHQ